MVLEDFLDLFAFHGFGRCKLLITWIPQNPHIFGIALLAPYHESLEIFIFLNLRQCTSRDEAHLPCGYNPKSFHNSRQVNLTNVGLGNASLHYDFTKVCQVCVRSNHTNRSHTCPLRLMPFHCLKNIYLNFFQYIILKLVFFKFFLVLLC